MQRIDDDPIEMLFLALADETDCLTYDIDSVEEMFPPLAEITDDAATEMLQIHSYSIFENANTVVTVNEDNSLENLVLEFSGLTDGVLEITHTGRVERKDGTTILSFRVEGSGEHQVQVESGKYPDISPLLIEMNKIVEKRVPGRFVIVYNGTGDSTVVAFILDSKRDDFAGLLHLVNPQAGNRDIYDLKNWQQASRS